MGRCHPPDSLRSLVEMAAISSRESQNAECIGERIPLGHVWRALFGLGRRGDLWKIGMDPLRRRHGMAIFLDLITCRPKETANCKFPPHFPSNAFLSAASPFESSCRCSRPASSMQRTRRALLRKDPSRPRGPVCTTASSCPPSSEVLLLAEPTCHDRSGLYEAPGVKNGLRGGGGAGSLALISREPVPAAAAGRPRGTAAA